MLSFASSSLALPHFKNVVFPSKTSKLGMTLFKTSNFETAEISIIKMASPSKASRYGNKSFMVIPVRSS